MFYTFLLVLLVSCSERTSSQTQTFLGDECQLIAFSGDSAPTVVVEIPEACVEGNINWQYPQGNITVTAVRSDVSYSLCIEESWDTVLGGVVELTGGANNPLLLPEEGEQTCTHDVYGKTVLQIFAPETMIVFTTFTYRIVSPQLEN